MYWCYSMFMLIIYKQRCQHMMQHMYKLFLTLQSWVDDFQFPQNYIKKMNAVENCQLKKSC